MKLNNNVKIKRRFMRDEAYDILRDWIMIGKLEPGEQLKDLEISEVLGISRTPIREALLRLEDDGLVMTQANRWTLVTPIDLEEAENIYSIVKVLECLALKQSIHHFTESQIEKLEVINDNMKRNLEKGDKISAFQADNEFHDSIVKLSNNIEISRVLLTLKIKIQRMETHYFSLVNNSFESYNEHRKIIIALREKNLEKATDTITANWENSLSRIRKNNEF